MTEIERELELSIYLEEWANNHFPDWMEFYRDVYRNRRNGIYLLKGGASLMDLLNDIIGNVEEKFSLPDEQSHLIPIQFASVPHLLGFLERLNEHILSFKPLIDRNIQGDVVDSYIIAGILRIVDDIGRMVERCIRVYKTESLPRPYQIIREQLFYKDIDGFVESVNGLLKDIPYLSRKKRFNEGHFQTMLQILLKVLGFEPLSEQVLSDGRIDMVVRLSKLVYIFEFKYTEGIKTQAGKALRQIKDKGYVDAYKLSAEEIIGVGISFSGITKNIDSWQQETLYKL